MPSLIPTLKNFPIITLRPKDWANVLVWPLLGTMLIGLLWFNTAQRIATAKEHAEETIRSQAVAAASSYAQQIRHMAEQIDRITLRLKHGWEESATQLNLEKEQKQGIFPASQLLYATIVDADGVVVTSTALDRKSANAADMPYFQLHQKHCCLGLVISEPSASRVHGRPIVRFSRRIEDPDGSFAGVAVVSVEPPYLTAFQETAAGGNNDFITVRLANGPLIATKIGQNNQALSPMYGGNPFFRATSGVTLEPAEKFRDNQARIVAWKKLQKYPLVALAGISVENALASFRAEAEAYREATIIQSMVILLLSIVAAHFAAKLAKRRRQSEETQETYRLATDAANEGFYMIRPIYNRHGYADDFTLEDCNNRAAELIGTTRDQLIGTRASELQPHTFRNEILALSRIALEKGFIEEEVRVSPRSPLKAKWIYRRIISSSSGLALTMRDISEEKAQEQALSDLANNDTLTQLPNRNWLNSFLPSAVKRASHRATRMAILFIDLDNFKNVNDTLGHDAGDELLIQAAQRLKSAVRTSDHVARLGGDEFVVILDQLEVEEDVSRVAKAIVHTISQPFSLSAGTGNEINASIGISLYPQDGKDAETLLKHADIAMYAAKAAGKGRYAFYHAHLSDSLLLRLSKERALRDAVEHNEFVVHYQPRVGVNSGRLTSMEALVRWERPQHGLVYPSEFIDMAEDAGLIVRVGELVIEKVCGQLAQWKKQGLQVVPVSINVSPLQLKSGTLSTFLASSLARYDIDASLIEAELTESAVIDKSLIVLQELAALRSLGIKLMIDDFGAGYSSMAQLHRLDVDVLKVDRGFTKALSEGTEGKFLFRAIMSMANALDMCVVAEGVETVEELNVLQSLSCDEIQGHVVSKAVVASEMTHLLLKRFLLSPSRGEPGTVASA